MIHIEKFSYWRVACHIIKRERMRFYLCETFYWVIKLQRVIYTWIIVEASTRKNFLKWNFHYENCVTLKRKWLMACQNISRKAINKFNKRKTLEVLYPTTSCLPLMKFQNHSGSLNVLGRKETVVNKLRRDFWGRKRRKFDTNRMQIIITFRFNYSRANLESRAKV